MIGCVCAWPLMDLTLRESAPNEDLQGAEFNPAGLIKNHFNSEQVTNLVVDIYIYIAIYTYRILQILNTGNANSQPHHDAWNHVFQVGSDGAAPAACSRFTNLPRQWLCSSPAPTGFPSLTVFLKWFMVQQSQQGAVDSTPTPNHWFTRPVGCGAVGVKPSPLGRHRTAMAG